MTTAPTEYPATRLTVNGEPHTVHADPATPLLYILRNDLGLKAAKLACGLEQCGACKVLIDGIPGPSCHIPLRDVGTREVTTLEGLTNANQYHPVQQAFIAEQAAQCGYCTAGMVVAAIALLQRIPNPSDDEIRAAMARHLCRCGSYGRVLRAVKRAASNVDMQEVTP